MSVALILRNRRDSRTTQTVPLDPGYTLTDVVAMINEAAETRQLLRVILATGTIEPFDLLQYSDVAAVEYERYEEHRKRGTKL